MRCALDLSDGLATGARLLAQASSVRVEVAASAIPLHAWARRLGARRALRCALSGGGDYELLASIPPRALPRAAAALARSGAGLTVVGSVTRGRGTALVHPDGRRAPLPAGYVHRLGR